MWSQGHEDRDRRQTCVLELPTLGCALSAQEIMVGAVRASPPPAPPLPHGTSHLDCSSLGESSFFCEKLRKYSFTISLQKRRHMYI